MTHPLALIFGAGEQVSGDAQRRIPAAHAAHPDAPPGAPTCAERPSWWSRSRDPGRSLPAFLDEISTLSRETTLRVGFDLPTTRRVLTGSEASGGSSILSVAFPREHDLRHRLSLAGPRRARVSDDVEPFWRATPGPRPRADRLDVGSVSPVRDLRDEAHAAGVDRLESRAPLVTRVVALEAETSRAACDAPPAPTPLLE